MSSPSKYTEQRRDDGWYGIIKLRIPAPRAASTTSKVHPPKLLPCPAASPELHCMFHFILAAFTKRGTLRSFLSTGNPRVASTTSKSPPNLFSCPTAGPELHCVFHPISGTSAKRWIVRSPLLILLLFPNNAEANMSMWRHFNLYQILPGRMDLELISLRKYTNSKLSQRSEKVDSISYQT